jgi:competence CoiA-like predicted nuclease
MIWAIRDGERILATPKQVANCPLCKEEVISKCGSIKRWHWSHKADADCDSWGEGETEWHINWKNEFPKEYQEVVIGKHRADIYSHHKMKVLEFQNSHISPEDVSERELFYGNMAWLLNHETLCKNLQLRDKTSYWSFHWKNPPKSFWNCKKPIYIDFSNTIRKWKEEQDEILEQIHLIYEDIKNRTEKTPHEIQKENPDITEGYASAEYRYNEGFDEVIKLMKKWSERSQAHTRIEKSIEKLGGEILLIKKIYPQIPCGGWGVFMTKEDFIKQFE